MRLDRRLGIEPMRAGSRRSASGRAPAGVRDRGRTVICVAAASLAIAAAPVARDSVVRGVIAAPVPRMASSAPLPPVVAMSKAPAPGDTAWFEPEEPRPSAAYGSFGAARDSVRALVRRALGAYADSATITSGPLGFRYRDQLRVDRSNRGQYFWTVTDRDTEATVPGLRLALETHSEAAPGYSEIEDALGHAGWVEAPYYAADGPDGTTFGLVCREALCFIEAQWEGGDDEDTTAVPAPGQTIRLRCVPRSQPIRRPGHGR